MKLKVPSLMLALALMLSCLAGCGGKAPAPETPTPTEAPAPTQTPAPTEAPADPEAPEVTVPPDSAERHARYAAIYEKYSPDAIVMYVDGDPIPWSEYFSWIYNAAMDLEQNYGVTDWAADNAYTSYLSYYAATNCIQLSVINRKAEEAQLTLTEEQQAKLDENSKQYVELFGGQAGFESYLASAFLTEDYFLYQTKTVLLYDRLYAHTFGENGSKLPDADVLQYLTDKGYLHAKHILFSTVDENRQPLDEASIAAKKAQAEEILARLRACKSADLAATFDELMLQYNEDPGMQGYPHGYYFLPGEMVAPFEEAAKALEVNEISGLVESDYGYHILYRPEMHANDTMGYDNNYQPYTPRGFVATALFNNATYDWYDAAQVVYTPEFEDLDMVALLSE